VFMRRRPLMRAAMVGGTAYAVGKHAARNDQREYEQQERLDQLEQQAYAPQQQAYAPPPAPAPAAAPDLATQLTDLQRLVDQGVLTPDEFAAAKQKLLAG
jgi:Short C-terminal domain